MLLTEGPMKGRSYIGFGTFYIPLVGTVETPESDFLSPYGSSVENEIFCVHL